MEQFGVGEVAALLGLTLFVIGYALGPMILVRRLRLSPLYLRRLMMHLGPNV
jgi:hypothetical protein